MQNERTIADAYRPLAWHSQSNHEPTAALPSLESSTNHRYHMNANLINAYLERAREIIGKRSREEIDYDDAVVANLSTGMDIKKSIANANQKYPSEALRPKAEHWDDLAARYQYITEHKAIITRLGIEE